MILRRPDTGFALPPLPADCILRARVESDDQLWEHYTAQPLALRTGQSIVPHAGAITGKGVHIDKQLSLFLVPLPVGYRGVTDQPISLVVAVELTYDPPPSLVYYITNTSAFYGPGLFIRDGDATRSGFLAQRGDGSNFENMESVPGLSGGVIHLVATWAANANGQLFLNGADITNTTTNLTLSPNDVSAVVSILGTPIDNGKEEGTFLEARVYSKQLSAGEVSALYAEMTP